MTKAKTKTLLELAAGQKGVIRKMLPGGGAIRQRLLDMGVTRGSEFQVERVAPLGDPVEIFIKGYHLAIRKNEASFIEVDEVKA